MDSNKGHKSPKSPKKTKSKSPNTPKPKKVSPWKKKNPKSEAGKKEYIPKVTPHNKRAETKEIAKSNDDNNKLVTSADNNYITKGQIAELGNQSQNEQNEQKECDGLEKSKSDKKIKPTTSVEEDLAPTKSASPPELLVEANADTFKLKSNKTECRPIKRKGAEAPKLVRPPGDTVKPKPSTRSWKFDAWANNSGPVIKPPPPPPKSADADKKLQQAPKKPEATAAHPSGELTSVNVEPPVDNQKPKSTIKSNKSAKDSNVWKSPQRSKGAPQKSLKSKTSPIPSTKETKSQKAQEEPKSAVKSNKSDPASSKGSQDGPGLKSKTSLVDSTKALSKGAKSQKQGKPKTPTKKPLKVTLPLFDTFSDDDCAPKTRKIKMAPSGIPATLSNTIEQMLDDLCQEDLKYSEVKKDDNDDDEASSEEKK